MSNEIQIIPASISRLGIRYEPSVVRALIPTGVIGAYLFLQNDIPIYVGRSDVCLRTRLVNHPLSKVATHLMFQPCKDSFQAYAWRDFGSMRSDGKIEDKI